MKIKLLLIALLALSVLVLAGCDDDYDRPAAPTSEVSKEAAADNTITEEEAIQIALDHAGLTEEQVTGLHAHLDRDDGRDYYEVEFWQDRYEYSYEIHPETGAILDYDKDFDD